MIIDNKKALGKRIKEIRKSRGIKQEQLAELIGVEPPSICNIENGHNYPTIQNLEKIVKALNSSYAEKFAYEKHAEPEHLLEEINSLLKDNPQRISDVYKIVKSLVE